MEYTKTGQITYHTYHAIISNKGCYLIALEECLRD